MDPTQSQRLQYTSSSTFRKPDKPSPATAVDFMYDSGKNSDDVKYFRTLLPNFLGGKISAASFFLWPITRAYAHSFQGAA